MTRRPPGRGSANAQRAPRGSSCATASRRARPRSRPRNAGHDIVRLTQQQDTDLLLVESPPGLLEDPHLVADPRRGGLRRRDPDRPADGRPGAGRLLGRRARLGGDRARRLAGDRAGGSLVLAGSTGDGPGRDASRLLASASLAIQRTVGVAAEPLLVSPDPSALAAAAAGMGLVVVGLSRRWQQEGLGPARCALVARETGATLLVRRGLRPGGLAPTGHETRFTWTIHLRAECRSHSPRAAVRRACSRSARTRREARSEEAAERLIDLARSGHGPQ